MRQAGVLAAAGLIALEESPKRLHEDHANAKFLAQGLAEIDGVKLDPSVVNTNIIVFDVSGTGKTSAEIARHLAELGVLASTINQQTMRLVTHCDVERTDCEEAINAMQAVVAKTANV
jgi:threonine aldolase